MATKVRKQIYIDLAQERFLKREAKRLGISEAEFIRRAIYTARTTAPWGGTDPSAIESFLAAARDWRKRRPKGKPWRWNREEIYEERVFRHGRVPARRQRSALPV
jgi:CO/xanthine dehydrogenase Mo-binding subunit